MQIILNGQPRTLPENATLASLVNHLGLTGKRYAIEVNESIVPRSQHASYVLQADDKVEIIQAIGGG